MVPSRAAGDTPAGRRCWCCRRRWCRSWSPLTSRA